MLLPAAGWPDLARTSHYEGTEVRLHLGLSREQFGSLGEAVFGGSARAWLDSIHAWAAALPVQKGRAQSGLEVPMLHNCCLLLHMCYPMLYKCHLLLLNP